MIHPRGYWLEISEANTHVCDQLLCTEIIKTFKVKTAIDIGCGAGAYTKNMIDSGIDCCGFDGSPLTPKISGGLCGVKDFSQPVDVGKFELVLSLEVGEHIPKEYEQTFIDNLCNASSNWICMSWGIIGQPGYGHVNCQSNEYLIDEMAKRGFIYDKNKSDNLRKHSTYPWFKNTVMIFEKRQYSSILDFFKDDAKNMVTVVLTSCGRIYELQKTMASFYKHNTYPIHEFIIAEDSGNKAVHNAIKSIYPECTLLFNPKNMGLVRNIDNGYAHVKTPYIFHLEDDWEFTRPGFIEKSLEILLLEPTIMQVWIRALNDTNGHPIEPKTYRAGNTEYKLVAHNVDRGKWHGFTWNPGLRRLSDYLKVGPFNKVAPELKAGEREMLIGLMFHKMGHRAAILPEGYVHHIGFGPKNYSLV